MVENWMISLVIMITGGLSIFAVTKNKTDTSEKRISMHDQEIKEHAEMLATHAQAIKGVPTFRAIREEFIDRKAFEQFEKRMDSKFTTIEKMFAETNDTSKEILKYLRT